ncbi:MAG: hypothetical protein U0Y68_10440 [Blastocatellia bacterium]
MPFSFRRLSKTQLIALGVIAVLGIAVFGVSEKLKLANTPAPVARARQIEPPQNQSQPPRSKLESEVIVLRERGFEPFEITRPTGTFALTVDTRIGGRNADLVLSQVAGEKVREVKLPVGKRAWREQINLPPGRYILTVANQPNAICKITITPPRPS